MSASAAVVDCPSGTHVVVEGSVEGPDTHFHCETRSGLWDGPEVLLHEDRSVRLRGTWVRGQKQGEFLFTSPAGIVTVRMTYVDDDLDGQRTFYAEATGAPSWYDTWSHGVMQGREVHFHPNGAIATDGWIVDGQPDGEWVERSPDGAITTTGRYVDRHRDGVWEQRFDGRIRRVTWQNGIDTAVEETWADGRPIAKGPLENEQPTGFWTYWNDAGAVAWSGDLTACRRAEAALATEIYARPGSRGSVSIQLDETMRRVERWWIQPGEYRDPAEIATGCFPGIEPPSGPMGVIATTAVPGAIARGGYPAGTDLMFDGRVVVLSWRWLE